MSTKPKIKTHIIKPEDILEDGDIADPTPEDIESSAGCEHCDNTGLEPSVGLSETGLCPVCHGSPFTITD